MNGQWPYTQDEMREKFAQVPAPSCDDVVVAFVACLAAFSPAERDMMVSRLREMACILCGNPDPNCPCWEAEEPLPS